MCGKHFGEFEDDVQVVARSYRSWEIWVLDNRFTASKTMRISFAREKINFWQEKSEHNNFRDRKISGAQMLEVDYKNTRGKKTF